MPDEFNDLFFGHSLVVLRAKLKFETLKTQLESERTKPMIETDDEYETKRQIRKHVRRLREIADNLEIRILNDKKTLRDLRAAADGMEKDIQK